MTERSCANGCTDECLRIWEERMIELEARWAKRAARTREELARRNHVMANVEVHSGTLQHIGELLSPEYFVTHQAPRSRSRLRVFDGADA